jgi:hypothetical protein
MVACAGPRRLKARPSGSCKVADRATPRGPIGVCAALPMSVQGFRLAVMIQVRWANGRRNARVPQVMPGCRANLADRYSAIRPPFAPLSQPQWANAPSRDRQHDRTAIRLRSVRPVARTIALRSYRTTNAPVLGEPLPSHALQAASLELRACLHAKASAAGIRMRRFTIVSCRLSSFQWQESSGFPRRACPRLI